MKQQKTIERKIQKIEAIINKFSNDETLEKDRVNSVVKRLKEKVKLLKWVLK